jgi:hypothetical protein
MKKVGLKKMCRTSTPNTKIKEIEISFSPLINYLKIEKYY